MSNLPVTLVTANAAEVDVLTEKAYVDIVVSLVDVMGMSYQGIANATGYNSKAYWHMVRNGKRKLDEAAKIALRQITKEELPERQPSVALVAETMVDPNAEVWQIGTCEPDEMFKRVLLLASSGAIKIYANGTVEARTVSSESRRQDYRPRLSLEIKERIAADGRTLEDIINAGLEVTK